ncbi:MAG TPA: hypothetical protein VG982_02700 [Candidatus Paceibacterota bacterium]|jgi:hypothetical protein|nr:hypothetical protein [Candidatus Paceibacterota bacterium]
MEIKKITQTPGISFFTLGVPKTMMVVPFLGTITRTAIGLPQMVADILALILRGRNVILDSTVIILIHLTDEMTERIIKNKFLQNEIVSAVGDGGTIRIWFLGPEQNNSKVKNALAKWCPEKHLYVHPLLAKDNFYGIGRRQTSATTYSYELIKIPKENFASLN